MFLSKDSHTEGIKEDLSKKTEGILITLCNLYVLAKQYFFGKCLQKHQDIRCYFHLVVIWEVKL